MGGFLILLLYFFFYQYIHVLFPIKKKVLIDSSNPIPLVLKNKSLPMRNLKHNIDLTPYSFFLSLPTYPLHDKKHMNSKRKVIKLSIKYSIQERLSLYGISSLLAFGKDGLYE